MFINHLALSYKCHSSIGNSLDLKKMLDEVLYTFVVQTDAISGAFYLKDSENNNFYKYIQFDEKFKENVEEYQSDSNKFCFVESKLNSDHSIIIMPVSSGVMYIVYKTDEVDIEFIGSMFQDLIVKLNISIDACLNVHKLKSKNAQLDKLASKLEKQKKELLDANRYQTNFLANISHELKTPLNSIIVLSSVMAKNKDKNLNQKNLKNIKIINNCGNDLLYLINDILDISKIESGELALNLKQVNIKELLEDIYNQILPLAKDKNLILLLDFNCENDISIFTDDGRIKQIIKNLLSNAIKFTDKGTINITLEKHDTFISIKVIDEGIGIEKSKLKTVFERFKQADGSTTRKYGGTGLGLSVSRELAELLSGELNVQSKVGEGSTFELILPLKTNITNISDEKVSIGNSRNDNNSEEIILFDDFDIEEEVEKPDRPRILLINKDHLALFMNIIKLQKLEIDIFKVDSITSLVNSKEFDLVIINDTFLSEEVTDIVKLFDRSKTEFLLISNETYDKSYIKYTIKHENVDLEFVDMVKEILGIKGK